MRGGASGSITVVGLGRVGLPFAATMAQRGLVVYGVDADPVRLNAIRRGNIPFKESGLSDALQASTISWFSGFSEAPPSDATVICVGTPLSVHLEANLSQLMSCVEEWARTPAGLLAIRSTVPLHTMERIDQLLSTEHGLDTSGEDFGLAYIPERIQEGHAMKELLTLPQIVGATDATSFSMASDLLRALGVDLLRGSLREAELAKLYCNVTRYEMFAIANQMAIASVSHGVDPTTVRKLANEGYERSFPYTPGFAAGTCLRKDFALMTSGGIADEMAHAAWRTNEGLPRVMVEHLGSKVPLDTATVMICGGTFKKDSDDVRDSLTPRLVRLLRANGAKAVLYDPYLPTGPFLFPDGTAIQSVSALEGVTAATAVMVAVPHRRGRSELFAALENFGGLVLDYWGIWNADRSLTSNPIVGEVRNV